MGKRQEQPDEHATRAQTDESLRVEREKADAAVEIKRVAVEEAADEVVDTARELADAVVARARSAAGDASPRGEEEERRQADELVDEQRARADAQLKRERQDRQRYLAEFLLAEREATDSDLVEERAHADTIVAARDEFLATVSHDLRGMLSSLMFSAELLLLHAPEGSTGDVVRKQAGLSKRVLARMNRLISDLLDVASIEAGKLAMVLERTAVHGLLADTLDAFEPIAAGKKITLDVDEETRSIGIEAELDAGRILQVLANVLSNALKFTPEGGRVSISIRADAKALRFAVSDTGIGITADGLESVFERFTQVTRGRGGLGLGLHISRSIVEEHGGKMWVESQVGVGSTFHFTLPL